MRISGLLVLSLALLTAACQEEAPGGGSRRDDAGAAPDGSAQGKDSGSTGSDTGVTGDDGGNSGGDAGVTGDDGGNTGSDGSVSGGDGGNTGSDGSVSGGDGGNTGSDGSVSGTDGGGTGNDGSVSGGDGGNTGSDGSVSGTDGGGAGNDGSVSGTDGGGAGNDGSVSGADGGGAGNDGGGAGNDGGGTSGDGGTTGGDGGTTGSDGGSPLDGSLSEFCQGSGSVVEVGASGECSGTVAEETFRFGVCTCSGLDVQSNLLVDGFDSTLGSYGAPLSSGGVNIHSDGHLGINGELNMGGRLTCMGSTFVSGGGFAVGNQSYVDVNVYAAGNAVQNNSVSTINRNGFVDGDVLGRFDINNDLYVPIGATVDSQVNVAGQTVYGPLQAVTPCPCGPNDILDIQGLINFGATYNDNATLGFSANTWANGTGPSNIDLPCGRYYLTGIQHPNTLTIRALGRTVLYVDGDLSVGGSLRLEVAPGAEIDLFVGGRLIPLASLRFGSVDHPSAVRTYIAGGGSIFVGANSSFGGNLYAPNATLLFSASTDIYGSLFCDAAFFGGNANVHFDTDIRSAGDECEEPPDGGVGDGGTGPGDGGTGSGDGGTTMDAGVPDSGPMGCTECYECQNQACLIPPGGGSGMCGPCVTDLDCCPTDICVNGSCLPTF